MCWVSARPARCWLVIVVVVVAVLLGPARLFGGAAWLTARLVVFCFVFPFWLGSPPAGLLVIHVGIT